VKAGTDVWGYKWNTSETMSANSPPPHTNFKAHFGGLFYLAPAYTNQPQTPSSEKWKRRELFPTQQHTNPTNRRD
ncbi:TPA: hypothetical protein ACPZOD_004650, partial [Yersinia enterocolitica]